MFVLARALSFLTLAGVCVTAPTTTRDHVLDQGAQSDNRLRSKWYHDTAHFAHALFARDTPAVGSSAWAATYPAWQPDASKMPAAWTASLNAAIAAGAIPDIPPSTLNAAGTTVYAGGLDPTGPKVCSATYGCRIAGDVWDAPDGVYALGFDDGPLPGSSDTLYQFLHNQSQHATHFMIGSNILGNQVQFKYAFETLQDDIAVHTYSHPMMTTLSNEQVVAELGYTVQLIRDLTGGLLPRFWRPPYGDSDARVRAIAAEVFGLVTIIWNQDAADGCITPGAMTAAAAADKSLQEQLHGPKSPGLNVPHRELSDHSVQVFISNYPIAIQQGWKVLPISEVVMGMDTISRHSVERGEPSSAMSPRATSNIIPNSSGTPASTSRPSTTFVSGTASSSVASTLPVRSFKVEVGAMPPNPTNAQTKGPRSVTASYTHVSPAAMLLVALPIAVAAQLLTS